MSAASSDKIIADLARAYANAWSAYDSATDEAERVYPRGEAPPEVRATLSALALTRGEAHVALLTALGVRIGPRRTS